MVYPGREISNRSLKQLITSQSGCREQDITTLFTSVFSIDTAQHPLPKEQYYLLWTGLSSLTLKIFPIGTPKGLCPRRSGFYQIDSYY